MKNPVSTKATQGWSPVAVKKDWRKPVLDILPLEQAQHGSSHIADGVLKHHSG